MATSMLSFVMDHLPENWEDTNYVDSHVLFSLDSHSREFQSIEAYFKDTKVKRIQRVQNPYQYGRYMLRREMKKTNYEKLVFHIVHRNDVNTALKFNCDPRRYDRNDYNMKYLSENGKNPQFYTSFSSDLKMHMTPISEYVVMVLKSLSDIVETQADYYIQYVVHF